MIYVFYSIHVIVCLFLILVVLLQQGKGADLSVFGGGSTQTAFGARSAATLLHKLTVVSFILFILTTLSIAVLKIGSGPGGGRSVVGEEAEEQTGEEATPAAEEPEGGAAGEAGAALPAEAPPAPAEPAGEGASTPAAGAAEPPPAEPPAEGGDGGR